MNNHFEPLDNGEVLSISESALIFIGHTTFRVGEFSEAVRSQLEASTQGWNGDKNSWFTDLGVDCEVLRFTSGGWQKGKVRIRLEFAPDEGESSGDPQNASAQTTPAPVIGVPEPIAVPSIATPEIVSSATTEESLAQAPENLVAPEDFASAALPIAAVAGTAVLGGIALAHNAESSSTEAENLADDLEDEDFNLAPPAPEADLGSSEAEEFNLDALEAESSGFEEISLEEEDFALDETDTEVSGLSGLEELGVEDSGLEESSNLSENAEAVNLEEADFSLEIPNPELSDQEFSVDAIDADLSDLGEEDFSLDSPSGELSGLYDGDTSLSPPSSEADLAGLEEDDFSLDSPEPEAASLGTEDFGFEATPESEVSSLGSDDFGDSFGDDFGSETIEGDLSGLGDDEFTLEPPEDEPELTSLDDGDFSLEASQTDLSSLGVDDLSLESLESGDIDGELSGLGNEDFDLDPPAAYQEISNLEGKTDFGLDALEPDFGDLGTENADAGILNATEESNTNSDFGLDGLLGDEFGGDDLESLSISIEDKQEFDLATAAVSQAFDQDLDFSSSTIVENAGFDSLDFNLAGDEELDAIEKQLAAALDDDFDLTSLGAEDVSEGLTENFLEDQNDSLFKDVWSDLNKNIK